MVRGRDDKGGGGGRREEKGGHMMGKGGREKEGREEEGREEGGREEGGRGRGEGGGGGGNMLMERGHTPTRTGPVILVGRPDFDNDAPANQSEGQDLRRRSSDHSIEQRQRQRQRRSGTEEKKMELAGCLLVVDWGGADP
jgi:hypothetical protein